MTVLAEDSFANPVNGASVTIAISNGSINGTLVATTNSAGDAVFSNLSENIAGTYSLIASSAGAANATSNNFVISALAASASPS